MVHYKTYTGANGMAAFGVNALADAKRVAAARINFAMVDVDVVEIGTLFLTQLLCNYEKCGCNRL